MYTFPDEDLCLFKNFPHKQFIIPVLGGDLDTKLKFSCTIIWLIQNHLKIDEALKNTFDCLKNLNSLYEACSFQTKFNSCKLDIHSSNFQRYDIIDFYYLFEWLKLIFQLYLQIYLAFLGVITNVLIMAELKNRNFKKTFKTIMCKHINFN